EPRLAAIDVEVAPLWVEFDGLVKIGERADNITLFNQDGAAVVECNGMARIEFERLLAVAKCRVRLLFGVARAAAVAPGIGQAGLQPDSFGVISQRGVKIAQSLACCPTIVPNTGVARVERKRLIEVQNRAVQVAFAHPR